jgi:hypothetical protein
MQLHLLRGIDAPRRHALTISELDSEYRYMCQRLYAFADRWTTDPSMPV